MKKIILLSLSLFLFNLLFAQEQAIKMTNESTGKEILIKENRRIKIKTIDGEKYAGRFSIEEGNMLLIKETAIDFADIEEIRRNPLLVSIFTSGVLIYGGALTAGMGVIIGIFIEPAGYLLLLPAAGMIYTGIKSPNFNRKFKKGDKWTMELITAFP